MLNNFVVSFYDNFDPILKKLWFWTTNRQHIGTKVLLFHCKQSKI